MSTTLPDRPNSRPRARRSTTQPEPDSALTVLMAGLDAVLAAAGQAPSPGDRRPWRFRTRHGALELLAAAHPGGPGELAGHTLDRQDVIACGAAVFNLRLAAGHLGLEMQVTLLPDPADPALLARLTPLGLQEPRQAEEELLSAVSRRRTRRDPFVRTYVPPGLLDHLAGAAAAEGTTLIHLPPGDRLTAFDELMRASQPFTRSDPAAGAGLRAPWPSGHGDGAWETGQLEVLTTPGDTAADWLRAGQGLQRLLLTATTGWVAARFFTLVLEVPALRERVRLEVCDGAHPQAVLEFGDASATQETTP